MDIIRDALTKAKTANRESSRALRGNGLLNPVPAESSEPDPGPLNPNRAQPTQRTQTPAFIHARHRHSEVGMTPPNRSRGRGQLGLSASLHPPNYASGRGLRGLESLEATTLGASSVGSELSIGIGRGRGRGFGRGGPVAPRAPVLSEVPMPPSDYSFDRYIINVQNLPIMEFHEEIINYTRNHPVTLIQGDTGCGKSTQVPQFLLDDAMRRGEKCTIVVTQPRRIAARSLAERVCVEREWDLGKRVGYQVGLHREAELDTNILYVTSGVLVEKLIHGRGLSQWTHIVLDEVHERSQDMDLCLLLVRQLMREERSSTRLILMSASADTTRLADYFSTLEVEHPFADAMLSDDLEDQEAVRRVKPPVITVAGRLFDVSVFYMEDIEKLFEKELIDCSTQLQLQGREDPFLLEQRVKIVKELILYFDKLDLRNQIAGRGDSINPNRGSVLVFLPGIAEISQLHDHLVGYSQHDTVFHSSTEELFHKWLPLPLHSVISTDKQRKIFDPPPRGYRKIILSTNIAESSITVPDISYVIDFCLTKRLRRDTTRSNFSSLNIEWASKSNCEQRKGRAGRIAEGQCYRLISRQNYANLEQHCPAEIQIAPLEQVILRVKLFDRHPKEMLDQAMDKPSFEDFGLSILTLKEVGALTVSRQICQEPTRAAGDPAFEFQERLNVKGGCLVFDEDYLDGDLTFVGRLISSLPVDVRVGKMIALGYAFGVLKDAIVVGAGLAGSKSIFKQPFQGETPQKALDAYERRLYYSAASSSDCFAVRNAYYSWKAFMNSGGDRGRETDLRQWCQTNHLDRRALYDMDALIAEIENRLLRLNIRRPVKDLPNLEKTDDQEVKDFMLQLVIAGAFYPNYFLRTYNQSIETAAERVLDGRSPHFCVELGNLPVERGILYNKQLVTKFKMACLRRAPQSCKPKIFFHDSKAVVDFSAYEVMERMKKETSGVNRPLNRAASLPVYLALKMRQIPKLRPFITVVNETDQLHEALDIYRKQTRMKYEVETDMTDSNRLAYDQHIGFPGLHTSRVKMRITHVPDCCHFFGVYLENCDLHKILRAKIAEAIAENACPPVPTSSIMPGFVCLAPRCKKDSSKKEYCRVRLDACDGPSGFSTWLVSSLDFGWTGKLPASVFLLLPEDLTGPHYPYLAVECFVANIGPHSVFRASGDFTEDDRRSFDDILRREERQHGFVGMSIYSLVSTHLRVILDVSLSNLEEHALEYREELMPSRTDHLERLKAQRVYRSESTHEDTEEPPHHREARLRALEQEEEKLMKELEESVMLSGTIQRQKINLVGPSHPYEMRFCGVTASASSRSVNLVSSSINTITLDDNPQCHLDRLLVASLIHSSETHTLNLMESTLMPNLPGLPSLVALIFAPVSELRVNKQRTRYTGALCGLGFDQNGYSLHPNNDMEVTFDIHVDDQLLLNVNKIRLGINLILTDNKWEDSEIGHHEKVVAELQQYIQKDVIDLFLKVRQPRHIVNPCLNEKPFSWRVLPPSAFVNPPEQIRMHLGAKALYQVHHSVTGVDKGGMSDFLRGRNRVLNADPSFDPLQLQEFRPRWENCMRTILDDLTGRLVRSIEPGAREVAASKVLDQVFVCELCMSRPDAPEVPERPMTPTYGFVCTTLGAVAEHLRTDEHRRAEMTIRYTRSPQLERVLMLLNR